ncbi:type 11 methyltransferase [Mycolicibacterium flavescens]|uniref:class I SAM-dependent methyltransferase n=1 Tax=Mycobacterium neumannii TaxID=2048551 RepID=UPI000F6DBCC8|nr:class I SAM-dependent methyltransferase [Mycobacterium neumannii]VEG46947.1 type 11 methyltransferase [Mycolicibacterium flavescens]
MSEAMEAEFDTVAEWTAQVAADLGPDYHIPAACRGSGSPAALDWLIERMGLAAGDTLLDCGAGVGGPAAYAAQARSVRPVLVEPESGACRAASRLFDHPVLCGLGSALPIADSRFDAAWSLGVLCTTPDQLTLLNELRRTVRPGGSVGLLAFVAHRAIPGDRLPDNHFPTPERLDELIGQASFVVEERLCTADLPDIPAVWTERAEKVETTLSERHGRKRAWRLAEEQSGDIGRLLENGTLTGELLILRHAR